MSGAILPPFQGPVKVSRYQQSPTNTAAAVSLFLLGLQTRIHYKLISRAADPPAPPIQNMSIDHCGADVPMPEQFLDCPDVVAVFQ